ncbi:tetraacyldisaccharide 4'-kinase [Candidatus Sulfurimonas marisnigri]|uniref:Tetraacyldisaccharide 4'-kinase n=1 Tax=Candidatus Sulfurimonas marisnigri TaxID=2740405 RepID=A0A7S7M1V3_9BACT|nr:tetraacyldisaccharide 4'-kinase [Candidatus Sulfurimonas marisnigri]QOY55577.1 tetraacyldisaccharide 4'-kinase [Candidatus Sulfurimonas marisnigri]
MKKTIVFWVEKYFYNPSSTQKLLSILLLPLSWIYCLVMFLRFKSKVIEDFGVDIVSIGNLSVGGSGKTPLVTALSLKYKDVAIVLRGYGRDSVGLFIVSDGKNILCNVNTSGDEAMIYAHKVPHAVVIVSEDRKAGIHKAKELGAKIIFLDDAYSKHDIKKLDILIEVNSSNNFCLPSGPFRERLWTSKESVIVRDGIDFKRHVELVNKYDKMSLVTAIARPSRLEDYLPQVVSKNYFEDHHSFVKSEIEEILKKDASESVLVTYKDFVKLESFNLTLSLLDLHVEVDKRIFTIIDNYRRNNGAKKD